MSTVEKLQLTPEYLRKRYVDELATVEQIAKEVGCSTANVRKRIKDWRVLRGHALRKAGKLPPWNVGLSKETDDRLAELASKRVGEGNPMAGRQAWNAGLRADLDDRVASIARKLKGKVVSAETREKQAAAKRGKVGELANRWQGGESDSGAYRVHRRTVDGRRMYAHRHVAERCLGRMLETSEHVHHIDRDEANNDPSNLLVISESNHAKLHGAIYRGECNTRAEQIKWLADAQVPFLELK